MRVRENIVRELKNAQITHVSYVDKAANKRKFFLTKSAEQPTFQKEVKIFIKSDDAQKLVYGVVYEPDVEDAHEDFMKAEEIEKAAHQFMKDARNIDKQHDFEAGAGEVVESYIAPADFEIGEQTIAKGSWVIVTKASDDIWEQIQKGEITGYSMAGSAEVIQLKSANDAASGTDDMKGFFAMMKNFFSGKTTAIEKGDVKDEFERRTKQESFWRAWDSFSSVIRSWNWRTESYELITDTEQAKEAIQDLTDILNELLLSDDIAKALGKPPENLVAIEKAGKKISSSRLTALKTARDELDKVIKETDEGEEEVTKEEMQKMLTEVVEKATKPLASRLEELEKSQEADGSNEENEQEELQKMLVEAVQKAIQPIENRLENVEKARGLSQGVAVDSTEVKKNEKDFWNGAF